MNFQEFINTLIEKENVTIEVSYADNLKAIIYNLCTSTYYDIVIYNKDNFIVCIMSRGHRSGVVKSIPISDYEPTIKALCKTIKEECMTLTESYANEQWLEVLNKYC